MPLATVPQNVLDAFRRILTMEAGPTADAQAIDTFLGTLLVPQRASVAQTGTRTLAAADQFAIDEDAGTYNVNVPAVSVLGDPWWYDTVVVSGTVSFVGGQATVPVAASGGGTVARLRVANGKVYITVGTTTTRVA